jgi:hypothetical protein
MNAKFVRNLFYLLTAALLIAILPMTTAAQGATEEPEVDDDNLAVFTGTVEELGETTLVVSGVTFDSTTADFGDDEIEVGSLVSVEFIIVEESPVAVRVALRGEDDDDIEVEDEDVVLVGVLEALEEASIVVSGLTIDTTNASIEEGVEVGATVMVEFELVEEELVAVEVSVYEEDDTCVAEQPEGWTTYTVEEGDTLSAIAVASDTPLDDLIEVNCYQNNRVLLVGAVLYVENAVTGDVPSWEEDEDDNDDDDSAGSGEDDTDENDDDIVYLSFVGTVEALGGGSMTASGMTFDVSGAAFDDDGIGVGSIVVVEYEVVDGRNVAVRITLSGTDDDDLPAGEDDSDENDDDDNAGGEDDTDENDDDNAGSGEDEDENDDDDNAGGEDDDENDDDQNTSGGEDDEEDDDNN